MTGTPLITFLCGAAGATGTLVITQALPVFADWKTGKATPNPTFWKLVGALGFAFTFIAIGGLFALFIAGGKTEIRSAVVYGVGWQGSWASLVKGSAAVKALQAGG
jgi:hypothetical protein